jgi:CRP-like cAMP-binding protein
MAFIVRPVLTVDIVDFSLRSGEEQMKAVRALKDMLGEALPEDHKNDLTAYLWSPAGDGGSITFMKDIHAALSTAVSLGKLIEAYDRNLSANDKPLQVRIGIHSGPVSKETDFDQSENVWGDGINMSARVMSVARPGQILASADFYKHAELHTRPKGEVVPIGKWWAKHNQAIELYNIYIDGVGMPPSEVEEWYGPFSYPLDLAISMYSAMATEQAKEGPAFRAAVLAKRLLDLKPPHEQQKLATRIIESISEERHPRVSGRQVLYDVFFSKLSPAALLHFFNNAEFMDFNKGDIIFEEGRKADSMMMIVSGQCTLSIKGQSLTVRDRYSDREEPLTLSEGEIIGEMGLFNPGETRTATLKATKTTIVLALDYRLLRPIQEGSEGENKIRKEIRDQIWNFYRKRTIRNQISIDPLLRELSTDQQNKLSDNSEFLPHYPDKPIQLDVNDIWTSWTTVVAGKLIVRGKTGDRPIGINKGDFLGPIRLVVSEPPYASVEVLPQTQLVRFAWDVIEDILHESEKFRDQCFVEGGKARFRLEGKL